jgi:multiple sugar transport system substrate-binding protein
MSRLPAPRATWAITWTVLVAGLILVGADRAPVAAQPATPGATPVELRVAWWGSQDRHNRTIKAIELFQKKYPHIKVSYEFAGWQDYWTKMTTQAAGRSLPDVMQQDYAYITEWSSRGLLAPLDDAVKSGVLDLRDTSDDLLRPGQVGGKLLGVNLGTNAQCWVLDLDAFKKAGVDLPSPSWTWADFEKTATALREKLGIWGMGTGMWGNQLWGSLYLSAGQWRYSPDGSRIGYSDDRPLVDYLQMLLRLQKANVLIPRAEELSTHNTETKGIEVSPIVPGKAAMAYMWSNQVVAVWKAAGEARNFRMVALPRIPGGKPADYYKASMFWSVTSHSKSPREAAMFVDFFTNSLEANDVLFAERGVPIASKVRQALQPKLGKSQAEMFAYLDRLGKDVQPIPPPDPPGHTEIVKNVLDPQVMDPVAYGRLAPEKGAALLRQEVNTILARAKKQ